VLAKPSAAASGITARPPFLDLLRQSGTRGQQVTSSAQSDEILLDYMATDPDAYFPELLTLAVADRRYHYHCDRHRRAVPGEPA